MGKEGKQSAICIRKPALGAGMAYQKFCYWVDPEGLKKVREGVERSGGEFDDEVRIPCRVLRASREISYCAPAAWDGFCKRRTSWYGKSDKAGKFLVVSNTPLDHLDMGNPILITESDFSPPRLPSSDELAQLIKSQEFQKRKPSLWEKVDPLDKEFYQRWYERHRPEEPFDFDKIFAHHSANHANFLDPQFFVNHDGFKVPYSIADSIRVCSCCIELFNILGSQWPVKYVVPCIGAVLFAHLPLDVYFEVNALKREARQGRLWSPPGKARGSQETCTRGEHPVPEDQFTHG